MIRNSIHTFNSRADTGIFEVPLNSIVQIIDIDKTAALTDFSGLVQKISNGALNATSTIGDFLAIPALYRDLVQPDVTGKEWADWSESLTASYKVGDVITGNGTEGALGVTYVCQTLPVTAGTFNIAEWSLTGLSVLEDFPTGGATLPLLHGGLTIREGAAFRVSDITLGNLVGTETVAVGDMIIALKDNPLVEADFNIMPGAGSASGTQVPEDFATTAAGDYPTSYNSLPIQPGASWIVRNVTASNRIGGPTGFALMVGDIITALAPHNASYTGDPTGPTSEWSAVSGVEPDIATFSTASAATAGDYPDATNSVLIFGADGPSASATDITRIRAGTVFVVTDVSASSYVGTQRIRENTRITAKVDNPKVSGFTGTEEEDNWSVETLPVSGETWDATFSYNPGESVVVGDNTWIALIITTAGEVPGDIVAVPTIGLQWRPAERSGRLWNAAYTYQAGDTAVYGLEFYLALQDNTNAQPDSSTADWQNIQSTRYNVALFTPTGVDTDYDSAIPGSSTEYPDSTGQTEGASWMVDGLPGAAEPIPGYEILDDGGTPDAGGLAGVTVRNGDKYILIDTSPDVWYLDPLPRVSGERAGLAWASHLDYYAGDIVSEAGLTYMAIADMVGGSSSSPAATPAEWTALDIYGRAWNDRTAYAIGDQVSYLNETYVCTVTAPSSFPGDVNGALVPPALLGDWKVTSQGRGIEWIDTEAYVLGDTVSYLTEVYTALGNTTIGDTPDVTLSEWKKASGTGGMLWLSTTSYKIGDVATLGGTAYVAKIANININPQTAAAALIDTNWSPHFSGLHKTPLEVTGGITTSLANGQENVLEVGRTPAGDPVFPNENIVILGDADGGVNIDGNIFNPIKLKNDTAIQAHDTTAGMGGIVNLVSRTSKAANTPPATLVPGTYNEEVILGDGGVVSAIRSVTGSEPVVRHGAYGTTDDFRIVHEGNIAAYEKGGVVWVVGRDYDKGDIVTSGVGDIAYVTANAHTSLTGDVINGSPDQPAQTNWTRVGYDVGGTAWKASEAYAVGDQVSRVSGVAPAATTLTYTCITAHAAQAWDIVLWETWWQDNNDGGHF